MSKPRLPKNNDKKEGKGKKRKGGVATGRGYIGKCPEVGEFGPTPVFCLTGREGDQQRRLELHVGACQLIEKNLGHDKLRVR